MKKDAQFHIYFCGTFSHAANNWELQDYPREKILKSQEKISGPGNTYGKIFWTHSYLKKKNLGPTKYPRENTWDPRNTHEKILWTHNIPTMTGWYDATRLTRSAMARDSQNLAHSEAEWCFKFWFRYCVNHPRKNRTF